MTERYWEADIPVDALLDWVDANVCEAVKWAWQKENPVAWIEVEDGEVLLTVAGPEKPEEPGKPSDIYTLQYSLIDELQEYANAYAGINRPRSEAQREDMRERVAVLHMLAAAISNMAAEADKCG